MRKAVIGLIAVLALVLAACSEATSEGTTATTVAADGTTTGFGDAAHGEELYNGSCIVCHGPEGIGVEGLGKPWVGSDFINDSTDEELVTFLEVGRAADDPANTTGIAMMPRGGNPSLTDQDLRDLVAYMRTLNP